MHALIHDTLGTDLRCGNQTKPHYSNLPDVLESCAADVSGTKELLTPEAMPASKRAVDSAVAAVLPGMEAREGPTGEAADKPTPPPPEVMVCHPVGRI